MNRWWWTRAIFVLVLALTAFIVVWPSLDQMGVLHAPKWVKDHITSKINRGLDLRGGMRLVYTVQVDEAIRDKRDRYADEMRQKLATTWQIHKGEALLSIAEQNQVSEKVTIALADHNRFTLKFKDPADAAKIDPAFLGNLVEEIIITSRTADSVSFKVLNEVEAALRDRAVEQAKKTIENRIDELGLREAAVSTRDEDIIIEVPGEDEATFNDIKDTIARTARLEFKMCDDEGNFFGHVDLKEHPLPPGVTLDGENAPVGPISGNDEEARHAPTTMLIAHTQQGELPLATLKRLKEYVKTLDVPDDRQVGYEECFTSDCGRKSAAPTQNPDAKQVVVGYRTYYMQRRADVTGEYITDAVTEASDRNGPQQGWLVALTFTAQGADKFCDITKANVKKRFAIILDDKVNSAPVIQTEICGGHATITMGGSSNPNQQRAEAKKLEGILRAGALPAPIVMSNDNRIGASLGADSIRLGLRGSMVGSILVLIFMIIYYHWGGLVADLAVLFNLLLQMTALAIFGASMTLPGIAGLALTIGMAVDANVLINERIREEVREGKSPRAAVEAGYHKAFAAIFDGHVTTALGGLLLYQFGSGPIKGFAVTLIIGIVASLFTAVFCTRIVFDWWVLGRRTKKLDIG